MELTKSIQETLEGMKLKVKYSIDNKNEVMCVWESGDTTSDESMIIIYHKKIDIQNIKLEINKPEEDLLIGLSLYFNNSSNALERLNKIVKKDYEDLIEFLNDKRGRIAGIKFDF